MHWGKYAANDRLSMPTTSCAIAFGLRVGPLCFAMLAMHTSEQKCSFQTASHAHQRLEKRGDGWASATLLNLQNSAGSATKRCGLDERGAGPAVRQTLVGVRQAGGQPRTSESRLLFAWAAT